MSASIIRHLRHLPFPRSAGPVMATLVALTALIYGVSLAGIRWDTHDGAAFWSKFGSYGTWLTLWSLFGVALFSAFVTLARLAEQRRPEHVR